VDAVLLELEVECGSGTYIRSLARDLAVALGTVGYLAALTRTRVGPFDLATAVTLDALAADGLAAWLRPASAALPAAPTHQVGVLDAARLTNGQAIPSAGLRGEAIWVYDPDGRVHCLATADGQTLRSRILL
jgi:tRNA pseudouridine55 synthase